MWIVKDKDGIVTLYYKKPKLKNGYYLSADGKYFTIDSKYYPFEKYGEPIEVDLKFNFN